MNVVINGLGTANDENVTGIQRVCRELTLRLDELLKNEPEIHAEYLSKTGAKNVVVAPSDLHNIEFCELDGQKNKINALFRFPRYVKKRGAVAVAFSHELTCVKNSVVCVHDVRPLARKEYDSKRLRAEYRLFAHCVKKYAAAVVTVSEYQKKEICSLMKIPPEKIRVIYHGWEHIAAIESDESVFARHPRLKKNDYYYALGSLAPHKNLKWLQEQAKRNPQRIFAVAGGVNAENWCGSYNERVKNFPDNVVLLGYVSDGENKALMQGCRAFLQPSKYEGFGIPPLEALACGAPIILSNATCLPEIYEDCARYFHPDDYEADIEALLKQPVAPPEKILEKCSWQKAAKQWLELIRHTKENS